MPGFLPKSQTVLTHLTTFLKLILAAPKLKSLLKLSPSQPIPVLVCFYSLTSSLEKLNLSLMIISDFVSVSLIDIIVFFVSLNSTCNHSRDYTNRTIEQNDFYMITDRCFLYSVLFPVVSPSCSRPITIISMMCLVHLMKSSFGLTLFNCLFVTCVVYSRDYQTRR